MWVHRAYIWNRYERATGAVAGLRSIGEGAPSPMRYAKMGGNHIPPIFAYLLSVARREDQPQPVFPPQFGQT